MARLPIPGDDKGTWGTVLNDFLSQSLDTVGALKANSVGSAAIADNAVTTAKLNNAGVANGPAILNSSAQLPEATLPTRLSSASLNSTYGTISSVFGRTGDVVGSPADVQLGNVNNTSDADKPVSTAQATNLLSSVEPAALVTSTDGTSTFGLWSPGRGQRPTPPPSKVITRFQPGHAWTPGASFADDSANALFGVSSAKLTTNGTGTSIYAASPTFTAQDWSTSNIRLWIKFADFTKIATFQMNIFTGAGIAFGSGNLYASITPNEWTAVSIPRSQFSIAVGSPVWTGVTQIQIRFVDTSTITTVWLGGFELVPDRATTYPNGVLIIGFDDGYAGQFTNALPILDARGIPATFYPIIERITNGSAGVTWDKLRQLQDKHGWQISNHAFTNNAHSADLGDAAIEQDLLRSKHALHANGLHYGVDDIGLSPGYSGGTGKTFLPEGTRMNILRKNVRAIRTNAGPLETGVPSDQMRIKSLLYSGQTVSQLQTNLDLVLPKAGNGNSPAALVVTFHDVITGSTDGTSNSLAAPASTNLATFLDYAISKGVAFRTLGDWIEGR